MNEHDPGEDIARKGKGLEYLCIGSTGSAGGGGEKMRGRNSKRYP